MPHTLKSDLKNYHEALTEKPAGWNCNLTDDDD